MGAFRGTLEFLPERGVLKEERASGLYHVSAYLVAKQVSSLPVRLTLPTLLVVISLPMAIPYLTVTVFLGVWAFVRRLGTCVQCVDQTPSSYSV